jgi:tRNA(Ile)-lysidine synthase
MNDTSEPSACDLLQQVESAWPHRLRGGFPIVIGVSGGADSVALVRLLHESAQENGETNSEGLILAHYNHGWRGDDSNGDQEFVEQLAKRLGHPFATETAPGNRPLVKTEESARALRYEFLERVTRQYGARYLATAHTADDQAETILHRVIRGTGLAGLTGIPKTRVFDDDFVIIRPLLGIRRSEIESYLNAQGQTWRHDASNDQLEWTRNRLRQEVLPKLAEQFHCDVHTSLLRLAGTATAALEALEPQIAAYEELVEYDSVGFSLPCRPEWVLFPLTEALRRAWTRQAWPQRDMTAEHWLALADVVLGHRKVCNLPCNIRAENVRGRTVVRGDSSFPSVKL